MSKEEPKPIKQVHIVEDCEINSRVLEIIIGKINPDIKIVLSVDGKEFLKNFTPEDDLVILDMILPYTDGVELLNYLDSQDSPPKVVINSGLTLTNVKLQELKKHFVIGIVQKPNNVATLRKLLT